MRTSTRFFYFLFFIFIALCFIKHIILLFISSISTIFGRFRLFDLRFHSYFVSDLFFAVVGAWNHNFSLDCIASMDAEKWLNGSVRFFRVAKDICGISRKQRKILQKRKTRNGKQQTNCWNAAWIGKLFPRFWYIFFLVHFVSNWMRFDQTEWQEIKKKKIKQNFFLFLSFISHSR